jgi:hypothetical protein
MSNDSGPEQGNDTGKDRRLTSLTHYSLLGRSGLRVSPLCLGTMTFGTEWGWGTDEATSRQRRMPCASGQAVASALANHHSQR